MHPAIRAPWFSASIAFPDNAPKLIPEMLTTDSGRNALARPRGPPSIFADGTGISSPVWGRVETPSPMNVRCLMIG